MKKLTALMLALVMLLTAAVAFAAPAPTVYKVDDQNGNTIYLFGTIHMMDAEIYQNEQPFGAALEEAYADSDILAVEVDLFKMLQESAEMAPEEAMASMMYPAGDNALNHGVSEQLLNDYAAVLGVEPDMLNSIKVNAWANLILAPIMQEAGLSADCGADVWLLQRAYADEKTVIELESSEEQNAVLDAMSDALSLSQVEMLIKDIGSSVTALEEMYLAWEAGDVETLRVHLASQEVMENLGEEEKADLEEYEKGMTADRDIEFFNDAVGFLERGEKALIAIGAAHIIGENAVVDRLTEAGYTVTKISE